jgi:hypothetical protein
MGFFLFTRYASVKPLQPLLVSGEPLSAAGVCSCGTSEDGKGVQI